MPTMDEKKIQRKEQNKRAYEKRKLKIKEPTINITQPLFEVKPLANKEEFDIKIKNMYNDAKDNILYDITNINRIINDEVEKLKSINEIVGYKNYNWSMAVKAQMGTGKTEKLVEYIKENPQLKILIVSFRKSLISKQFKELENIGFKTYLDFEGFKIVNEPKMIVQIDSLYKVFGEYDLIILDEVKSINEQLVLQVKNKIKCISALIERVKMTPMLYIADANLIIDDLEFFNKCGRQFVIYNNMYKKHTTKSMSFVENKNLMLNAILDDLSNNKKLIVPTGSKEFAISVQETINEKLPHIKVKLYTGGKKYDIDPTEEWIDYDCVIYTSCICAGNSFVLKHFDNIYGYFPACSNSPNIALQMLFRCRNFDKLFICVEERGTQKKLPFKNLEETKQYFVMKDKIAHKDLKLYIDGYYGIKSSVINDELDTNDPYFYLYCNVSNTLNKGKTGYSKVMIETLKEMGLKLNNSISIKDMNDEQKENILLIQDDLKTRRETHEIKRLKDIASAEPITKEKYVELQKKLMNDLLTNEEYNACKKYTIKEHFKITETTLTPQFIEMTETHGKQLDKINHIINNFNNITENHIQNIADNLNKTNKIDDILDFITTENKHKYKDVSIRLKNSDRLFTTHQIFKIFDMLSAVLTSSYQFLKNPNEYTKTFNYNEIFINEEKKIYNIDFDMLIPQIYDVIKPYKFFNGLPKREYNFNNLNENYIEDEEETTEKLEIKGETLKEGKKQFNKFITKLMKYINTSSKDFLGISIKKDGKNKHGHSNYYIVRDYTFITIPKTNFKYAIKKGFEDKIVFSDNFINKSYYYQLQQEENKEVYEYKEGEPTFSGIDKRIVCC